jgi:hypothetical protein
MLAFGVFGKILSQTGPGFILLRSRERKRNRFGLP